MNLWQHIPYLANRYRNHMKTLLTFGPLGCLALWVVRYGEKDGSTMGCFLCFTKDSLSFFLLKRSPPPNCNVSYCAYNHSAFGLNGCDLTSFFLSSAPHMGSLVIHRTHTHKFPLTCFQITCHHHHYSNLSCALPTPRISIQSAAVEERVLKKRKKYGLVDGWMKWWGAIFYANSHL